MMSARNAFTLIELMIVFVILAILAIAVVPDAESTKQAQAQRAADMFEADVDYARSLSIARPDAPVGIKVAVPDNKYWLAVVSMPDTPILHPQTGRPYVRQFGPTGPDGLQDVQITSVDVGADNILVFTATGGTDQQTAASIQFEAGMVAYQTQVSPAGNKVTTASQTTNAAKLAESAARQAARGASQTGAATPATTAPSTTTAAPTASGGSGV